MLFNIFDSCIFADMESMDSVMLARLIAAVVDSAARNDEHISALTYIKIIINKVVDSRLGDDNGDMNALILRSRSNNYVDARLVGFRHNLNVGG